MSQRILRAAVRARSRPLPPPAAPREARSDHRPALRRRRSLALPNPGGPGDAPCSAPRPRDRRGGVGRRGRLGPRPRAPRCSACSTIARGFDPRDDVVARLHRDADGLRLPAHRPIVLDALVPAILSQRVTGFEAKRSYRTLVERWGEPAPGPGDLRLTPPAGGDRRARLLRPPRDRRRAERGPTPSSAPAPTPTRLEDLPADRARRATGPARGHRRRRPLDLRRGGPRRARRRRRRERR